MDDCEKDPCDLCLKRQGGDKSATGLGGIFVANRDGTFTCENCLSPAQKKRLGDDDVEVWEVGSHGWMAPLHCWICHLSIEVYVDGDDRNDPTPELKLTASEMNALERVHMSMDPVPAVARRLVKRRLLRTNGVSRVNGPFRICYVVTRHGYAAMNAHPKKAISP